MPRQLTGEPARYTRPSPQQYPRLPVHPGPQRQRPVAPLYHVPASQPHRNTGPSKSRSPCRQAASNSSSSSSLHMHAAMSPNTTACYHAPSLPQTAGAAASDPTDRASPRYPPETTPKARPRETPTAFPAKPPGSTNTHPAICLPAASARATLAPAARASPSAAPPPTPPCPSPPPATSSPPPSGEPTSPPPPSAHTPSAVHTPATTTCAASCDRYSPRTPSDWPGAARACRPHRAAATAPPTPIPRACKSLPRSPDLQTPHARSATRSSAVPA